MAYEVKTHDNGLPYIDVGGHRRVLAALPEPPGSKARFKSFRDSFPILPRSEWREMSLLPDDRIRILDQDGYGACVGHGSVAAFETAWKNKGGTDRAFSAFCLYGQINGGRDNGAVVSDALDALKANGVCLESTVPPNMAFQRNFPSGWKDEAARFKIARAYSLDTFDEMMTAVQLGFAVSYGIEIGGRFDPGSDGFVPSRRGGGGGHCMATIGTRLRNGTWYSKTQNSWSRQWGANGICYMDESYFPDGMDAWAVQVDAEDPQEPNVPPKVA